MTSALPIAALIEQRSRTLGFTRAALVQRLGYRNIAKGLRSLECVCNGDLGRYPDLMRALPSAFYRLTFQPHAVILARPAQIFVIALLDTDHLLRINVDLSTPRDTWLAQAVAAMPERVLGFDKPDGVVMNYSPDDAVHFDLATKTTMQLFSAKCIGRATLSIGG